MNDDIFQLPQQSHLRQEVEALFKKGKGYCSPERMVAWAKRNKKSKLHQRFEWNNGKAAHLYRLWQARKIIAVHVEVAAEPVKATRAYVSLEGKRNKDEGYQRIRDVLEDPFERRLFLEQARRELERWREKYSALHELAAIFEAIDNQAEVG